MRRFSRIGFVLLALALFAAGCGDDGGSTAPDGTDGPGGETGTTTAAPRTGGTLQWAVYSQARSLDPAQLAGGATVGSIELQAIYDTIVRWDPETKSYENRTAASLEANADSTSWTLKLKDGITFTDGTAYDAEAVKFNVDRQSAPTSRASQRALLQTFVEAVTVVDPLTVRFDLTQAWTGFPYLLSRDPGMVASPAAIQRAGTAFGTTIDNAGAGPFKAESFKPGESLTVVRNPDYYGEAALLDGVEFIVPNADPNLSVQNISSGQLHAAYLLDPVAISAAKDAGLTTINMETAGGSMIIMNSGVTVTCNGGKPEAHCAGQADGATVATSPATKDPLVRRAVAAAIDPQVINARVYEGKAHTGSALWYDGYAWDPGVPGPKHDPAAARDLVSQAKANGFDGNIRVVANNDPAGTNWGIAVKTMLDAVGFNTIVDSQPTGGNVTAVLVNRDYDLATWGLNIPADDGVFGQLFISFHSKSNRYGYSNAEMDAAIDALRVATSDAEKTAALGKVAELYVRDAPFMIMTTQEQNLVTTPKLQGLRQNSGGALVLDQAWLAA